MPKVNLPLVPLEERDRRWALIRKGMQEEDLDALFLWGSNRSWGVGLANLRYVTHMGCREGVAIFPFEGNPKGFTSNPHHYQPYNFFTSVQNWVDDIEPMTGTEPIVEALRSMGLAGARIGVVDHVGALSHHSLPYWPFKKIQEELPQAHFVDATTLLEKIRMIKSPVEIEFLKEAGKIGMKMLDRMIVSSKEGVNERVVYGDMMRELVVNGGEDYAMNLFTTGSAVDSEQQHLLHGKEVPNTPVDRVLKKGDLVMTEFHANYGGYLVGNEDTISVGEPPQQVREIHKVCVEVFQNGVDSMRPGKTLRQVVDAFRAPVKKAGMDYIECGIHGHGMSSPEFPSCVYSSDSDHQGLSGAGFLSMELQEGMVFGTNIDVLDPSWRPDVGVMLGDTIWVSKDGPQQLCGIPLEWSVV